ncbi:MAG TPA: hypothetical protein VK864_14840, partial [Longimicrobiales bacterium]|nr:hypothetical protein [Longimicrobiales bacterium]
MPRVRAFASLVLVTSALRPANTLAQQPAPPVRDTRAEARALETERQMTDDGRFSLISNVLGANRGH